MESLNERIKRLRKEKGLTQLQLAEKLNVTDKAVSKWEVGEANPDLNLIIKLAALFDVSLDYLLTGDETDKKIIVMSNMELCCKNDDVAAFDKLVNYTDDSGVNILDYIKKYESKKVLSKLVEKYAKGEVKYDIKVLAPVLLNYGMCESLIKAGMLDYSFDYRRSLGSNNLYFKSYESNYGPRITLSDYESYRTKYDNRQILFDNWPKNEKILDYYFGFKSLIPDMEEFKKKHPNSKTSFFDNIDYSGVYYDFLTMSIDAKDANKVSLIWKYASAYNKEIIKEAEQEQHSYFMLKPIVSNTEHYHRLVSLSTTQIIELLKMGLFDIAREANEHAHIKMNWNNWKEAKVEENQFKKYELIKNEPNSDIDIRLFDVMVGKIVIISRLLETNDPKFIIDTLKKYPIYNTEYLYKAFKDNKVKEIYEFAVDNDIQRLAKGCFNGTLEQEVFALIYDVIYQMQITGPGCRTSRTSRYKKIFEQDKMNGLNFKMVDKYGVEHDIQIRQRSEEDFFIDDPEELEEEFNGYRKELETLFKSLDAYKNKIMEKYEAKLQMLGLTKDTLTKDFFLEELKKGNIENCVIKLCTLFEIKLKAEGKTGDFSELVNGYCSKFYGDDGWGYDTCFDPHKVDILNRLRMQRNNYLHADAKDVKPLTAEELVECINEICDMEVR